MIKVGKDLLDEMIQQYGVAYDLGASLGDRLLAALESLSPEAKRDLAAQLMRSASEAEGYEVG